MKDSLQGESNDKNFFAGKKNSFFTLCSETRYKLDLYLAFAAAILLHDIVVYLKLASGKIVFAHHVAKSDRNWIYILLLLLQFFRIETSLKY